MNVYSDSYKGKRFLQKNKCGSWRKDFIKMCLYLILAKIQIQKQDWKNVQQPRIIHPYHDTVSSNVALSKVLYDHMLQKAIVSYSFVFDLQGSRLDRADTNWNTVLCCNIAILFHSIDPSKDFALLHFQEKLYSASIFSFAALFSILTF